MIAIGVARLACLTSMTVTPIERDAPNGGSIPTLRHEFARRQGGDVKRHAPVPLTRLSQLSPAKQCGFL